MIGPLRAVVLGVVAGVAMGGPAVAQPRVPREIIVWVDVRDGAPVLQFDSRGRRLVIEPREPPIAPVRLPG
ncbi:MAG: hypothetical protein QOJ39_1798 [Candidatus Eremiobacteraeota bacterium]|nr:hypothetical protein [Candidatus Eremiobacteraeota bacterium]